MESEIATLRPLRIFFFFAVKILMQCSTCGKKYSQRAQREIFIGLSANF